MKVNLRGWESLERALATELPKATARNTLRRAAVEAMKPVEDAAKSYAPVEQGKLRDSITTKPAKAKRISRTRFAQAAGVTVLTGPTGREAGGNASWQEFGTVKMAANPYMRPAADSQGQGSVDRMIAALKVQIDKAKARIARKAARGK